MNYVVVDYLANSFEVMASLDDITVALRNLTLTNVARLDQELGRGAYGKVFTVKYREKIYAAKEVHSLLLEMANPEEKRRIKNTCLRECYHCSLLNHPNVVRFIGIYYPQRNSVFPVIVMELMAESLTNYVKKPNISMKMKATILYEVAFGLNYLHTYNPPIIHRDLSPNNILLSRDSVAKISDLGVAKVVQAHSKATQTMLTKVPGTADFMPPESFEHHWISSLMVELCFMLLTRSGRLLPIKSTYIQKLVEAR